MKTKLLYPIGLLAVSTLALVGCRTTTVVADQDAPPRYADRVQVITYDSTPRPFNPAITVFNNFYPLQNRPRHPIAELDMIGWPRDQVLMRNALVWRAKALGADGVLMLPPTYAGWADYGPFAPVGRQFDYRAEAFVWPQNIAAPGPTPPPPPSQAPGAPAPTPPPAPSTQGTTTVPPPPPTGQQ